MGNNFFVRIISLTSVDIMVVRKCSGVNECSDFSEDETESEVSSSGSDNESSKEKSEESDGKNDDAPGPSKHVQTMMQVKQSDWKWTKTDNNPVIYPFTKNSGMCDDLLSKSEAEPPF
jgi:hypothetical protein